MGRAKNQASVFLKANRRKYNSSIQQALSSEDFSFISSNINKINSLTKSEQITLLKKADSIIAKKTDNMRDRKQILANSKKRREAKEIIFALTSSQDLKNNQEMLKQPLQKAIVLDCISSYDTSNKQSARALLKKLTEEIEVKLPEYNPLVYSDSKGSVHYLKKGQKNLTACQRERTSGKLTRDSVTCQECLQKPIQDKLLPNQEMQTNLGIGKVLSKASKQCQDRLSDYFLSHPDISLEERRERIQHEFWIETCQLVAENEQELDDFIKLRIF